MIKRKDFFDHIRTSLFGGKLTDKQVEGISAILDEYERQKLTDLRWLAYILATCFHESGKTMQPVSEVGKGKGHWYGTKTKQSGKPYKSPNKIYYGRSFVQLTWYENYERFGKLLNIPLLEQPELALRIDVGVKIMFEGMIFGLFTGKKLSDYFNATIEDWVNSRKIINGLDRAALIAGYGNAFLTALK